MTFRLGITRDMLDAGGQPAFGSRALQVLDANPALEWEFLGEAVREITPDIAARYDGLYVSTVPVTRESVSRADCRVRVVARHGVGFDSVDVPALTERGIVLTNTPHAVRRPVAVATLTLLLALAGKLLAKDRLTRAGRWTDRTNHMGLGLIGRTLGVIGAGSIGQEILRLAAPFGLRLIAADPYADAAEIAKLGARSVPLEELIRTADFIVVSCLLTSETHHLVGEPLLALARPEAYLINVARGPIVDEPALIAALRDGRLAGAALDVFEQEPVAPDNPLLAMDNVIVTPHALCWTDECFHAIAATGLQSVVDFSLGRRPAHVVNPEVLGTLSA